MVPALPVGLTLLSWLLVKLRSKVLDTLARQGAQALGGVGLVLLPIAAIVLVRITLYARFPSTHALFGDGFNHAM